MKRGLNPRILKDINYFLGGFILGGAFGFYLWGLYGQLTLAFYQQKQLNPTRVYSDVIHINRFQPKHAVLGRLNSLGYSFKSTDFEVQFTLHPIEYPHSLLPSQHLILETKDPEITLTFEGRSPDALLTSIQINHAESPDLYLEPEVVSTLSSAPMKGGDSQHEIRTFLKFEEIPSPIWKAIIAIEDQHFLEHNGLDPRGTLRAIWVNFKTFSFSQGGSTITQQLVKNLMARRTKNIFRKINELFLALLLEAKFDKEKILERYLNEVYLGQIGNLEIHGIAEGAKYFFGKKLEELNLAEAALIAGLIRGPSYYSPYRNPARAFERQHLVLKKMVETGQLAEAEALESGRLPIRLLPPQNSSDKAPYFTDYVKAELIRQFKDRMSEEEIIQAGLNVYTTLDTNINRNGQQAVLNGIIQLEKTFSISKSQRLEGALAVVDHSTGYIRALIGGRNYSESNFNRILNMKRQVGSTFKSFVYLTAFEKGLDPNGVPYSPGHPAEDAPWTLSFDRAKQSWSPRNYEKTFRGWVSFRTAIVHSINTVAARLGLEIGIRSIINTATLLGIQTPLPEFPSLSLGSAELSPIELLKAYATLANRGDQIELSVLRSITQTDGSELFRNHIQSLKVFDSAPIELLHDILSEGFAQKNSRNSNQIGLEQPAAGKTGTTNNHRDAWFAGYTPQLTTVVWVGMDHDREIKDQRGKPQKLNLTGANSAFPIWLKFMKTTLLTEPIQPFAPSPHLVELQIDSFTGKLASFGCPSSQVVKEKFIKGLEPQEESCAKGWPANLPRVIQMK